MATFTKQINDGPVIVPAAEGASTSAQSTRHVSGRSPTKEQDGNDFSCLSFRAYQGPQEAYALERR